MSLYGGVASLTGERFDNIPESGHTSNLIWDAGLKLAFNFSKRRSKAPVEVSDDDAARLAAEREAAERERLAAEQAERERAERLAREQAEREAAERLAREKAEREAAEAAARKEEAFRTQIPTVYFAHNSHSIDESSAASLQDALSILEQYPDFNLEIHAYSSRSGQKQYNEQLSKLRMEEVMQWFTSHGISMERMEKAFFHGVDYDAPSADKARRADIQFVK